MRKYFYEGLNYIKIYNVLPVVICFFFGRMRLFGFLTPMAFPACACFGTGLGSVCAIAAILGILSKGMSLYIGKYFFVFAAFLILNPVPTKAFPEKEYSVGLAPCLSCLLGGGLFGAFYGFSRYYIFINTVESAFSFFISYILDRGFGLIDPYRVKKLITTEEIISLIVIMGGIICGTEGIFIFGAEVSVIAAAVFMLTVCYKFGSAAGACCGSIAAGLFNMQGTLGTEAFPVMSLGGFIGGFLYGKNRGLTAALFMMGIFLLALKFSPGLLKPQYTIGVVLAATLFLFLPDRLYYKLNSVFSTGIREPEEYIEQACTMVENTLKSYSFSFKSLGSAFSDFKQKPSDENIYNTMTDEIAHRMCSRCSLKTFCWDKNYYITCEAVYNMLINMEERGIVDLSKVSRDFKSSCMAFSTFISTVEKVWETERVNQMWQNRYSKTKAVMRCYLDCVSELLFNLSSGFRTDMSFDKNLSMRLSETLRRERISIKSLSAGRTAGGRLEIIATLRNCDCTKQNTDRIIETINNESSERIMKEGGIAVYDKYNKDLCTVRFIWENRLRVGVKILKEPKNGSGVSGDSHTFTRIKDGTYLLALSDGMGSGIAASEESAASLDLFTEFISSGFSKETSIRLINTCLEMNTAEDSFATLDACIINLYSGDTSIIKTGACPTYILRGNHVEEIRAAALPVGILADVALEILEYKLKKNDTVIMVTDGAADSFRSDRGRPGSLTDTIRENSGLSYPKLCDALFNAVKANYKGRIPDDITIMVARIY